MPLTKVTSGAITDSAITTAKIEDGTIVNADINASANIAQSKLSLSLPTISSITIQDSQGAIPPSDTSLYFDIIGTNFSNPSTVELLDSSTNVSTNATTVTYVSATQLRVTASLSAGTYKIRVTRSDGFAGTSSTALLTVSQAVSWSTSAGSLGTFDESLAISTITLSATSNSSVTYAVQSGSLPTGLSLNTSNGEITGTPSAVSADTTSTFTIRATDAESQYADREFTITVTNIVIQQSLRFNDDDSARLTKTFGSAGTRTTWTFSTWVKRSLVNDGTNQRLFASGSGTSVLFSSIEYASDKIRILEGTESGSATTVVRGAGLNRDVSAWQHVFIKYDSTEGTASNRIKIYLNGVEVSYDSTTYPALNYNSEFGNNVVHTIGATSVGSSVGSFFDGYMAECHFIDGQALTPSSFGETGLNGRWKPKTYSGTYGTNGFYLDFADSGNLGDDESGNTNDFTATNLAATDQVKDTPQNNFATWNPLDRNIERDTLGNMTWQQGNLYVTTTEGADGNTGTIPLSTSAGGKFYYEVYLNNTTNAAGGFGYACDLDNKDTGPAVARGGAGKAPALQPDGILRYNNASTSGWGPTISKTDIVGIAIDLDNEAVYFAKNNSWIDGSGGTTTFASAGNAASSGLEDMVFPFAGLVDNSALTGNFGQDSSFAGAVTRQNNADENGYGDFYYSPPSGYVALCTNNLPEPTIKDSSEYFHTQLYTGDGTTGRSITNDANAGNFKPDFLWIKERSSTSGHRLTDSSRGVNKVLLSEGNNAELTRDEIGSYDTDGFTIDGTTDGVGAVNENTQTYVAWQWKANGGTTSSNTDGSITSTVQANTTAGFSIVTYTGTGTAGTIGHGLGKKPQCILLKNRSFNDSWITFHEPEGATKFMSLDTTGASSDFGAMWNDTEPTTSVFGIGSDSGGRWVNSSGDTYVAYCFAGIPGYSKFGKYTGNGNADGTFVYTGFKPAFVLTKRTDSTSDWHLDDSARDTFNVTGKRLFPNLSNAEDTGASRDFLSNGFKIRNTFGGQNTSGGTYIYMAFAESPFGGILTNEATAR